jgi:phospholipid/cholesterol/gamma-HCH transport system substrate-binding protein
MMRKNEFLVGLVILAAVALVVIGALFLSEADLGGSTTLQTARFRSIGRLTPGSPVLLRGVRVGTVQEVRLADNEWVEVDLRIDRRVDYPARPAVIVFPGSLFGEWQVVITSLDQLPTNPVLRTGIMTAAEGAGDRWPGADLPGIGELTAEASRIATDVGLITSRVEGAIDSTVIAHLQATVADLREMADRLNEFAQTEASTLGRITTRASTMTDNLSDASASLRSTLSRLDTATGDGTLSDIMASTRGASANIRDATADVKELTSAMRENRETLVRVLQGLDTLMIRLQRGEGTLALLTTDSTLYRETTATVIELRSLLADIRVNPRKYFRFSVF